MKKGPRLDARTGALGYDGSKLSYFAACVTVTVDVPNVNVPLLVAPVVFAWYETVVAPVPFSVAPDTVNHDALLFGVVVHPAGVLTVTAKLPELFASLKLAGVTAYVHVSPGSCENV